MVEKEVLKMLIAPGVGAFIGYFTNYLAIKMLFRPYRKYTVWKLGLPFTPGLIPKKRKKLIEVIAKMVKEELLTKELIVKRMEKIHIKEDLQALLSPIFVRLIENLENYIKAFFSVNQDRKIEEILSISELKTFVSREYKRALNNIENKKWEEILPPYVRKEVEKFLLSQIESVAEELLKSFLFKKQIESILKQKISFFLFFRIIPKMEEKIISTISGKIEEILRELKYSEEVRQDLILKIKEEWKKPIELPENLKEAGMKFLLEKIEKIGEKRLREVDKEYIKILTQGIKEVLIRERQKMIEHLCEDLYNVIKQEIPKLLESFDVEKLVKERLNSLSLKELEKMILKVSREELKYITFLGGVIGFIVGVFQALLQLF